MSIVTNREFAASSEMRNEPHAAQEGRAEGGLLPTHGDAPATDATERTGGTASIPSTILRLTIGVDPGICGALVVLPDGEPLQFVDMPTVPRKTKGNEVDAFRLATSVRKILASAPGAHVMAVLEPPSTRPGESPTHGQHSGEGYGVLKGVFATLGIRWVEVRPQTWKRYFGLLKTEKDVARQFAMNRFQRHAVYLSRKKDNGRGDAALIALWAWETEQHAEVA
jgi:crossover junction endodeoxyribonuclease RuvC